MNRTTLLDRIRLAGRRPKAWAAVLCLPVALAAAGTPVSPAAAAPAPPVSSVAPRVDPSAANPSNPLTGRPWGVYEGRADAAWQPYVDATGEDKALLAKIALRPKALWFGAWISNADIATKVHSYIENASGGDPNTLVQMTVFRMQPWEHDACTRVATDAERASYRQWIRRFATAIGQQHVALILQPDGPFALCAPGGSRRPSRMIAYATRKFSAQPNTSVYIDAGASDWPSKDPVKAADILMRAGVVHARGFALNSTHYATTEDNIDFGAQVVAELASRGVPGKHLVINTSSNGRGFTFNQARGGNRDNAKVCQTMDERVCVTLGIPPTSDVADPEWGLSSARRSEAGQNVDGYLWFGRPWLYMQASPFVLSRALDMARTTPW